MQAGRALDAGWKYFLVWGESTFINADWKCCYVLMEVLLRWTGSTFEIGKKKYLKESILL